MITTAMHPFVESAAPAASAYPQQHVPSKPTSPRSALAATYSTYIVRVHTRHGIKTISFDLLANFFTYTAKKAAEDLGISSRTLIRVCRSLGIRRWPYLGFRSEKNVERIRQEAIENLRRKLEREGAEPTSPVLQPNTSCLRGASAKRLLQVKLPQVPSFATLPKPPRMHLANVEMDGAPYYRHGLGGINSTSFDSTRCINTLVSPSAIDHAQRHAHAHAHAHRHAHIHRHGQNHFHTPGSPPHSMLLTPPPTQHSFNLDMAPSVSPRRPAPGLHLSPFAQSSSHHHTHSPSSSSSRSVSPASCSGSSMPSLNVLVDASILTAFKNDVESHVAHASQRGSTPSSSAVEYHLRTMSMRDILSNSTTAA